MMGGGWVMLFTPPPPPRHAAPRMGMRWWPLTSHRPPPPHTPRHAAALPKANAGPQGGVHRPRCLHPASSAWSREDAPGCPLPRGAQPPHTGTGQGSAHQDLAACRAPPPPRLSQGSGE